MNYLNLVPAHDGGDYEPRYLWVGDKQYVVIDPVTRLVLDPDNPEQIRELADRYESRRNNREFSSTSMEAVVRALLPQPSPVRPPEPADVPSTVTDIHGVQWVKFRYDTSGNKVTWISSESQFSKYDDIEVVS